MPFISHLTSTARSIDAWPSPQPWESATSCQNPSWRPTMLPGRQALSRRPNDGAVRESRLDRLIQGHTVPYDSKVHKVPSRVVTSH